MLPDKYEDNGKELKKMREKISEFLRKLQDNKKSDEKSTAYLNDFLQIAIDISSEDSDDHHYLSSIPKSDRDNILDALQAAYICIDIIGSRKSVEALQELTKETKKIITDFLTEKKDLEVRFSGMGKAKNILDEIEKHISDLTSYVSSLTTDHISPSQAVSPGLGKIQDLKKTSLTTINRSIGDIQQKLTNLKIHIQSFQKKDFTATKESMISDLEDIQKQLKSWETEKSFYDRLLALSTTNKILAVSSIAALVIGFLSIPGALPATGAVVISLASIGLAITAVQSVIALMPSSEDKTTIDNKSKLVRFMSNLLKGEQSGAGIEITLEEMREVIRILKANSKPHDFERTTVQDGTDIFNSVKPILTILNSKRTTPPEGLPRPPEGLSRNDTRTPQRPIPPGPIPPDNNVIRPK